MIRQKLKFSLRLIQGAIGKKFVIKHYKWGIIKTRYPDMSNIIASAEQRKCRDLFKEAVAFARTVLADDVLRERWENRLRKKYRIFNAVIKEYMLMEKRALDQRVVMGTRMIRNSFKGQWAVISQQSAVGSGQLSVGSGQWAVGSGQWTVGSQQWAVGSGQSAVGSGQSAVGSGQWAVGSG